MKDIHDVIKHTKFGDDRLRGLGVAAGQISALPIDFAGRPYNTLTLPCERVILHTHPFNGPFSGTTRVSRYQKGKTNLDFTEARDSEWQWHQLGHIQVCNSVCYNVYLLMHFRSMARVKWRYFPISLSC